MPDDAPTDNTSSMGDMHAPKRQIVVVNDDLAYLELMRDFLQEHDFEVAVMTEPDVTLGRIKEHNPHLVIIDLIFGKEPNGWLILQHMNFDPRMKSVPVLMCSAAVEQMQARAPEFAGPLIDFLEKPFDLAVMHERICALLEKSANA